MADGREVLDGVSGGAAVACLGYSNPDLVDVMARQAAQMPYAYHQALGHDVSEELAQFLVDRSGGAFVAGAFLNSGMCCGGRCETERRCECRGGL
jgi:adenosylmethionine-8-amino-7-oxononanoate aminotransferase